MTNEKKVTALTAPAMLGLLILAYTYCAPGLARLPNLGNEIAGRVFFIGCVLCGTVTSVLGMVALKSKWEALDGVFKSMMLLLNLGWLGVAAYIAVHMHSLAAAH